MPHANRPLSPAMSVVEQGLLGLLFLGAIALLSLPAARGTSAVFGWMPLWLLGLPAAGLATALALRAVRASSAGALRVSPARRRRPSARTARRPQAVPGRRPRLPRVA